MLEKREEREEERHCIFSVVQRADSIYFHVIIFFSLASRDGLWEC